jgi:hypothetical protein
MTNKEIKSECEKQYAQIKSAEERLKQIRTICKHEKTFQGKYQVRIGQIWDAHICEFCGEPLRFF